VHFNLFVGRWCASHRPRFIVSCLSSVTLVRFACCEFKLASAPLLGSVEVDCDRRSWIQTAGWDCVLSLLYQTLSFLPVWLGVCAMILFGSCQVCLAVTCVPIAARRQGNAQTKNFRIYDRMMSSYYTQGRFCSLPMSSRTLS